MVFQPRQTRDTVVMRNRPRSPVVEVAFERVDGGSLRLTKMVNETAILVFLRYVG